MTSSAAGETILRGTIQVVHESETNRIAKDIDNDDEIDNEEPIRLESCRVTLGCLDDDPSYRPFVQTFRFQDFEGLEDFLTPLRERILQRHPETLRVVHQQLQGIVQEIVNHHPDTQGRLGQCCRKPGTSKDGGDFVVVAPFATPNVRLRPGGYATFLHADAIFPETRNTSASSAMINLWIPLGTTPISNFPLCFYKCPRNETVFSENKLYYCGQERDNLCFTHSPVMQWGSFLCFVAGQPVSDDIVLLHGAVNLEDTHDYDRSSRINKKEPRQSIELRYLL